MKVTVEGNELVIRLPINPQPSKSGKTTVVCSSHGNHQVEAEYQGKKLVVGANAYVAKDK